MHIVAFAASNSRNSINKRLVTHAAEVAAAEIVPGASAEILDLNDYEMPIYSIDRQMENGFPPEAKAWWKKIIDADAILISFAEHNGSYSTAYKNIYDWVSRMDMQVYKDKPMILFATSPSPKGGQKVLDQAIDSIPFAGGNVLASLSVPTFDDVFDSETGSFKNEEWHQQLRDTLSPLADLPGAKS